MSAQGSEALQSPTADDARRPVQPLCGRLPALKIAQAQLMRRLFDAARTFTAENGIRLSIAAPAALPRELIECEAGGERILVGFARDEILDACAGGIWGDYQGAARCSAWTMAHERVLHALSNLLGHALLPRKILIAGNPTPGVIWLGLRANLAQAASAGVLALPLALAQSLADTLHARGAHAQPSPRGDAGRWRETLLLTAAAPRLSASDLADLGAGDVIVLGSRASVLADLHVRRAQHRTVRWPASWQAGRVHIRGAAASGYARSYPVNDTAPASDNHDVSAAKNASAQAPQIPVALEFELGAIDASLHELARIEPGYVFDLPLQLDHATVTIRSGGRRVGRGELVAVGDTLGVRLTEWTADGT